MYGTYLRGPALQCYNFSSFTTYDFICGKIKKEFSTQIDYPQQLYYCKQSESEPLIAYFYNLSAKAKINDDAFENHFINSFTTKYKWMLSKTFSSKIELRKTIFQI